MPADDLHTKPESIPTNLRLLFALEEVARAGVPVTPTEVNAHLGLPKPTVHRLFATLEEQGYLQRDLDGRSYSPGNRLRRMSVNVLSSLRIRTARVAVVTELANKIGETCNIATPDRDAMRYLDRVETKWPLRIQLPIGTTVPFHCTASGKMYLSTLRSTHLAQYLRAADLSEQTTKTITDPAELSAEMKRVQSRGYSTDDEEFMTDMVAVAVPINDDQGRLISTLSVHAPVQRITLKELEEHVPLVQETAERLSQLVLDS